MRLTMLAWTLAGLLLFLLWARRLLGLPAAVLGGCLLALDPAFYFLSICDWGPVVPGYVCRFAGFYCALRWWQGGRARDLFLAGLALGLGVFHKVDFLAVLAGCGVAVAAAAGAALRERLRQRPADVAWGLAGLLFGAGLMAKNVPRILRGVLAEGSTAGEAGEKMGTLRALFDGSYFYRLLEHGGSFERMFDSRAPVAGPFGLVFALALALLAVVVLRSWRRGARERALAFLLLATPLVLAATWLLPGAVRLHHWTLVYPLPHLVVAAAAVWLWRRGASFPDGGPQGTTPGPPRGLRPLAVLAVAAVLGGHLLAIARTERLIAATGGRGLWSNALDDFAAEVRTRRDLTIVSYDWGFYEPLAFLTDGPRLLEPTWSILAGNRYAVPTGPAVIHLVHPPEYQVLPTNAELLARARATDPKRLAIRAYLDRQGRPAFYAIRFLGE